MSAPKTVVVTGATGGVGRGVALACGESGWTVWIAARRQAEGEAVAKEVDARGGVGRFVPCDVGEADSVAGALDAIRASGTGLDGVVHNATHDLSPRPVELTDAPAADLSKHVAVALRGAYLLASRAWPLLRESRGSLLLMTSEAGFEGKARLAPYAGVKAAQRGFARALAREWGGQGVRVNCLAPLASSPAMERALDHEPELASRVLGRNPLGRLGDAETDIGRAARFLLSDDARYVTGHTLMVDGGSCPAT